MVNAPEQLIVMRLLVAESFTKSLLRLGTRDASAVKRAVFDHVIFPEQYGPRLHRLAYARDRDLWSLRATRDVRVILQRRDGDSILCYVDHHEGAYAWAEQRRPEDAAPREATEIALGARVAAAEASRSVGANSRSGQDAATQASERGAPGDLASPAAAPEASRVVGQRRSRVHRRASAPIDANWRAPPSARAPIADLLRAFIAVAGQRFNLDASEREPAIGPMVEVPSTKWWRWLTGASATLGIGSRWRANADALAEAWGYRADLEEIASAIASLGRGDLPAPVGGAVPGPLTAARHGVNLLVEFFCLRPEDLRSLMANEAWQGTQGASPEARDCPPAA